MTSVAIKNASNDTIQRSQYANDACKNLQVITNATIVLKDKMMTGTVVFENGKIVDLTSTQSTVKGVIDFEGDYLIPGLVELHTDNLEKHFMPRPKVMWPAQQAVIAHDAQLASSGITTVFDAVSVGEVSDKSQRVANLKPMLQAVHDAQVNGLMRSEHFVHLRCELSYPGMMGLFNELIELPAVHLASLMDHAPGQRQFTDLSYYKTYYQGKFGFGAEELEDFMAKQIRNSEQFSEVHRKAVVAECKKRNIPMASHDDATLAHIEEAVGLDVVMAEFPTTKEAAHAAHNKGMGVLMGAPNVVRGGSHSGNIAAHELASEGVLDILSSDYCPASLLHAAFILADKKDNDYDLAKAIETVSYYPAKFSGLNDRGEIAVGKRADMLRVCKAGGAPFIKHVWREGMSVF